MAAVGDAATMLLDPRETAAWVSADPGSTVGLAASSLFALASVRDAAALIGVGDLVPSCRDAGVQPDASNRAAARVNGARLNSTVSHLARRRLRLSRRFP